MTLSNVLFLVGSPKARNSTSESLGNHVVQQLADADVTVETFYSHLIFRTPKKTEEFIQAFDRTDLLLITYPLYVDSLPYLLTKALETLADHRAHTPSSHQQRLACIGNCGFPEPKHLDLSLEILHQFALETDMDWYGGLAIGEGGAVDGAAIPNIAGRMRHQVQALELMGEALIAGHPIPDEAVELAARPIIPYRLYTLMGAVGWHYLAHQHAVRSKLYDTPYTPN